MPFPFQTDYSLKALNTLGLPGKARRFGEITSAGQLVHLVQRESLASEPCVILGGGSNVVLSGELDATVLRIAIPGRERVGGDDDSHFVRAGAGENWHEFVQWTLDMGWPGLENLSYIPGSVGAAPVQNIGAYGLEVCERFMMLEAVDLRSGAIVTFDRKACNFDYRNSVFKQEAAGRFAITSVTFALPKRWRPQIAYGDVARELESRALTKPNPKDVSEAIVAIRRRKLPDPSVLGNAGSFFKNPLVTEERFTDLKKDYAGLPSYPQPDGRVKLAAGWLIEQVGWKGKALGPVGMYEHQALILVNHGGATGEDVLRLAAAVRRDVIERFGVALEMEPILV